MFDEEAKLSEELKNINSQFYQIINVVPVSIYWKDQHGVYWGCNKYTLNMANFSSLAQIVGKKDSDMPWKDIAEELSQIDNAVIKNKRPVEIEEHPILANKQKRTFFTTKTPLLNNLGEAIGLIGVSVDITELKNTRDKLRMAEDRLKGMTALGANIAHELRTPLFSIEMGIGGAKRYLPILLDAYFKAKQHNLDVENIRPQHLESLVTLLDRVKAEAGYSNTIINMLLMNIKQNGIPTTDFKIYSMKDCVNEAIRRYPFKPGEDKLIKWKQENNFLFKGDKDLMIHILFNLIKNALYFIEAEGKGEITIWCNQTKDSNLLFFQDTARGIPAKEMLHLFEKFHTTLINGTGLGLAFCKSVMLSFAGDIVCESEYREFTKFTLNFPPIKETKDE